MHTRNVPARHDQTSQFDQNPIKKDIYAVVYSELSNYAIFQNKTITQF